MFSSHMPHATAAGGQQVQSPLSVSVTVMDVAHMGVDVGLVLVFVRVRVGFGCRGSGRMLVPVVVVVHMGMIVSERVVSMKMGMPFSAHHHNSESHQRSTCDLGNTELLIENGH